MKLFHFCSGSKQTGLCGEKVNSRAFKPSRNWLALFSTSDFKSFKVQEMFSLLSLSNLAVARLFCRWAGERRRQLKMNEFVLSFHTRKGKKRGAWVTRHWELLRKGELCFINTHTQIPIRSSEPPAAPVNNRSLSGVCDEEELLVWGCV